MMPSRWASWRGASRSSAFGAALILKPGTLGSNGRVVEPGGDGVGPRHAQVVIGARGRGERLVGKPLGITIPWSELNDSPVRQTGAPRWCESGKAERLGSGFLSGGKAKELGCRRLPFRLLQ